MNSAAHREVVHEITIDAPAGEVYTLIADVGNWPQLFPPTIYVDHVERSSGFERIRIWATANGEAKNWISRRVLDLDRMRIDFRQEVSSPPVASMGGAWIIERLSAAASRVRLLHDYRAIDDDPDQLAWLDQAVDRNSRTELAALKTSVERATAELTFSFADTVHIDGAAKDVYDFLNEAGAWRERLPHVARVVLTEDTPGLQVLEMDTTTRDGSTHTTKSVRVCFPHNKIVYKQLTMPALMTLHTGEWLVTENGGGVAVTSRHTVSLNEENITAILGANAGVPEARDFVRDVLSTNSLTTLGKAKDFAESRH